MVGNAGHQGRLDGARRRLARGLCRLDGRGAQTSRKRLCHPRRAAPPLAGEAGRAARDQGIDRRRSALPDAGLAPFASMARQRGGPDPAEDEIHHLAAVERQCGAAHQHGEVRGPPVGPGHVGRAVRALQARSGNLSRCGKTAVPAAGGGDDGRRAQPRPQGRTKARPENRQHRPLDRRPARKIFPGMPWPGPIQWR